MSRPEAAERLREAAANKSAEARARVMRALVAMESRGQTINFNTVAAEAKVSKGYLYKQPDLRQRIAQARTAPPAPVRARTSAGREAAAEQKLRLASEAIQRLKAEVSELREENARLRGDLVALRRKRTI